MIRTRAPLMLILEGAFAHMPTPATLGGPDIIDPFILVGRPVDHPAPASVLGDNPDFNCRASKGSLKLATA
jgi:hypothetical protein